MKAIASALINILQTKSENIISQVQQQSAQQFICVKRSIIDWSRLKAAEPGTRNLLKTATDQSQENSEWFKHIEICPRPETPGLLFSVRVNTQISEHNLIAKDQHQAIASQRKLADRLLQIVWVPRLWNKVEDGKWEYQLSPKTENAKKWVLPEALLIEYDVKSLTRRPSHKDPEEHKQYHAAGVAAFSILVYCCLWLIIDKIKQNGNSNFTALMLRLQDQGKESAATNGDSYVYAVAQTLEAILAEDIPIRMQGVVLENLKHEQNQQRKYIQQGIFNALLSTFPLAISTPHPPVLEKIGLISYANRPCNETIFLSSDEKSHLFLTQSYTTTAIAKPFSGYELKAERMESDIIDSPEQLQKQRLVQEEIRHLKNQGCQHIILLSHSYGSRRLNRTSDQNSALIPKEFLQDVFQTFPD